MASNLNNSSVINTTTLTTSPSGTLEKARSLSPPTHETVRIVGIENAEKAAECLSQAFAMDEVARYFIDTDDMAKHSEEVKLKLHCDIILYITAAHCLNGLVTTIGPDFDAVALWLPPHTNIDSFYTLMRSGLWRLYYKLSPEGRHRYFTEFIPLLHDTKHAVLGDRDENSWYLVYLGSKPSARGKGYARALIEHGIGMADSSSLPIYLESSALANISYYKKFGFEEKLNISLTHGPKPIYLHIMVREPKSSGKEAKGGEVLKKVFMPTGGGAEEKSGGEGKKLGKLSVGGSGIQNGELRVGRAA